MNGRAGKHLLRPRLSRYRAAHEALSTPALRTLSVTHSARAPTVTRMNATEASAALQPWLRAAHRIVVFTGAGISTESGIPDFRSPAGIWSKFKPIQFHEFVASHEMRTEAWRRKFILDRELLAAAPNRGHRAVATLVSRGDCACVITQNIDGLHQASGVPTSKIVELHGNGTYAICLDCGARHELAPLQRAFETTGSVPDCATCGGLIKSATVSFGQAMPPLAMARAQAATLECDLFLVLGSSLVVQPAATFPLRAKRNGAILIILNREPTAHDRYADLVLNTEIGPTLGDALGV